MTRTKYGVSSWIDEASRKQRPDYPRFHGTVTAPVVIVGGGLTGCMTAYAFAASGIRVVLVEAVRIAQQGSGHGPGVLKGEAGPSYRDVERRHGRKAARAIFESSRRAVLDLAATARRLGLKPPVDPRDAIRVLASMTADEKALRREADLRRDAGLEAVWIKAAGAVRESKVDDARGAVRLHDWAACDPYRLTVGFARAAEARGAAIFERSGVRRVKVRRKDVEVHVDGGVLTTETVVICTGEPTDLYRPLKRHVRFDDRYVVLTDRVPAAVRRHAAPDRFVITDTAVPPHVIRWADDGRLMVAGGDQPRQPARTREKVIVQRTGQLMYELSRFYPAISGIAPIYGWDQPLATTPDGVMYAGPHRNYPRHLFAWATRHDPAQAFLASRILLRHYLGEAGRDDAYFGFTRGG
jgi:glycine/D-amino acid oxidase-like deaminating enzyme